MKLPRCGVMIARGDPAVEAGPRLAEVQEEISVGVRGRADPVIWATQVSRAWPRTARPSRAEMTDAAMSHRRGVRHVNKGLDVTPAVHVLDDILRSHARHQTKRRAMLRGLQLVSGSPGEESQAWVY